MGGCGVSGTAIVVAACVDIASGVRTVLLRTFLLLIIDPFGALGLVRLGIWAMGVPHSARVLAPRLAPDATDAGRPLSALLEIYEYSGRLFDELEQLRESAPERASAVVINKVYSTCSCKAVRTCMCNSSPTAVCVSEKEVSVPPAHATRTYVLRCHRETVHRPTQYRVFPPKCQDPRTR